MSQITTFNLVGGAGVLTLTGDAGGAISPVLGDIILAGGTGISTSGAGNTITIALTGALGTTDHAVQVGNATAGLTSLAVGATGEILIGNTGADPSWSASPTVTTMYATTFDTNVAAAAVTLSGTTLSADGTDADININITAKGTGTVIIDELTLTTDLAVTEGGTGASTLTDHGILIGSGVAAIDAMSAGTAGQLVTSSGAAADPVWTTATYPATAAIGDVLVASAANTISVVTGAATAGWVLTANGAGTAPTFQANPADGIVTLAGDSGTATGSTVTIAGGTNITTAGAAATLTVNLDAAISGMTSITMGNAGSLQTDTTDAHTMLIQAYDVDGTTYVPFITLTNANTPTCDLDTAVTIGTKYIYRADGTDVPVTDGGTGASSLTDHGVLLGSGTAAVTATAVGATGEIFVGVTGADATWLAAGDANKVLTAHGAGSAVTWETPGAGTTWLTKSNATGDATATVNYAYTINHATPANLLTITLPATAAVGDRVEIVGNTAGMWKLVAAAGDTIKLLSSTTSAGGYLLATTQYDCVEVVCTVADTTWVVCSSMGNLTVA